MKSAVARSLCPPIIRATAVKYFTGIVLSAEEPALKKCVGRGWRAYSRHPARPEIQTVFSGSPREILIEAARSSTAQRALSLIQTCHELIDGAPNLVGGSLAILPEDLRERSRLYPAPLMQPSYRLQTAGFPAACRLAAKASRKRNYEYAIALYHVSKFLHANHPMDLHELEDTKQQRSAVPHDQVRFAYSIISAYAVVEQLGLALHGPAFNDGKWIQEKRADLESRLKKARFNLSEPFCWLIRGGRTRIEISRKAKPLRKAEWAWGTVRDVEVDVVDAIAYLRWLRSQIAAHDVKHLARLLSVYEVASAQDLARRCIMTSLGCEDS